MYVATGHNKRILYEVLCKINVLKILHILEDNIKQ